VATESVGKMCRWLTERPAHSLRDPFRADVAEATERVVKGLNTQLAVIPEALLADCSRGISRLINQLKH
jgi:hypothetical protein